MKRSILSTIVCLMTMGISFAQSVGTPDAPNYKNQCTPIDTNKKVAEHIQASELYGKTIVVIGDSYVRNHRGRIEDTWHYQVADKYNMQYHNYGRNGSCIAFDRKRWGISMLNRYTEMIDQADYVLVIGGHNDAEMIALAKDTMVTDVNRKFKSDSLRIVFEQHLRLLIDGLIAKYPSSKIAFVSPWNVDRAGFAEMFEVLTRVCAEKSVPLYNAAKESGIYVRNAEFRRRFFQGPNDTAHLNPAGHRLFMNKAEHFMLGL